MNPSFHNRTETSVAVAEDGELVERIRRDPETAAHTFELLYHRYIQPVYYYLYARTGNPSDAEDLTEQVFLDALEGIPAYHHQGCFAAWLFTIARRRAVDHYRRKRPDLPLEFAAHLPDGGEDPLNRAIRVEDRQRLSQALTRLREDEQELLRLRFAAGLGFREIAELLNRGESAVKMSYYRLLRRLESLMESNHA